MARTGVRLLGLSVLAALWVVGCARVPPGQSASTTPASKPTGDARDINPANIRRLRGTFPPGFEVADDNGSSSPTRFWGFGQDWSADPVQCAALADPLGGRGAGPRGLSGSGPGGIVYVVVASSPVQPVALDPAVVADCGRWSMASGRTTATVQLTPAPQIDGAATLAMDTATRTVVEGGTETDSQAHTAMAYLGDYLAFVTVVTDPGSTQPQLPPEFSSAFLVRTVGTLRG